MTRYYDDVTGSILIPIKNKMVGRVTIIAVNDSDIFASITVKKPSEIRARGFIYSDEVIEDISYPPRFGNQRKAYMTIPHRKDIQGNIFIRPENKMTGVVDIIPPPRITLGLNPTKDAFVRSSAPTLNHGTEQSMLIGRSKEFNEVYRSFIEFDLSSLPEEIIIEKATLKIYNQKETGVNQYAVYKSNQSWRERDVTWVNQPKLGELIDLIDAGNEIGYVSFDVTSSIKKWHENPLINNGFVIRAINENRMVFSQFSTRENIENKPILEIVYYDKTIYSFGRVDIPSNVFVYAIGCEDLKGSLYIRPIDENATLPSNIHIYNPDMIESHIAISRPFLDFNVVIRQEDGNTLYSNLLIRNKEVNDINSNITISTPYRIGRITIPYREDLSSSVIVRGHDWKNLISSLKVSRDFVNGRIRVRRRSESSINGTLIVQKGVWSDVNSNIRINRRVLPAKIQVGLSSYLNSNLTIRKSDSDDLRAEIVVPHRSDLKGALLVTGASMIPGNIYVLSGYLKANLKIPEYETHDRLGKMIVRVRWVSEIAATLMVGGDNIEGGYVIII